MLDHNNFQVTDQDYGQGYLKIKKIKFLFFMCVSKVQVNMIRDVGFLGRQRIIIKQGERLQVNWRRGHRSINGKMA